MTYVADANCGTAFELVRSLLVYHSSDYFEFCLRFESLVITIPVANKCNADGNCWKRSKFYLFIEKIGKLYIYGRYLQMQYDLWYENIYQKILSVWKKKWIITCKKWKLHDALTGYYFCQNHCRSKCTQFSILIRICRFL